MRDGLHAIAEADRLRKGGDWAPALYKMNRVSQEWLIRPMGIFQLDRLRRRGRDPDDPQRDEHLPAGQEVCRATSSTPWCRRRCSAARTTTAPRRTASSSTRRAGRSPSTSWTRASTCPFDRAGRSADGELGLAARRLPSLEGAADGPRQEEGPGAGTSPRCASPTTRAPSWPWTT